MSYSRHLVFHFLSSALFLSVWSWLETANPLELDTSLLSNHDLIAEIVPPG